MILEGVIPAEHLEILQDLCQTFIDQMNSRMDREATNVIGINHRNKRYFIAHYFRKEPKLGELINIPLINLNPYY